jgi:hypothetical protein
MLALPATVGLMPRPPKELAVLRNLIVEADLLLTTSPLPENRSGRAHELLTTALAVVDDLGRGAKNPAAALGSKGGQTVAKRGPEYFRELQARRKHKAGGRPTVSDKPHSSNQA